MPKPTKLHPTRAAQSAVLHPLSLSMLLIVLTLGVSIALTGCRGGATEPESAEPLSGTFYQIDKGHFTPVLEQRQLLEIPFQPWTVQGRVSDLVALEDRVYLGVNGHGIAEITFPAGEELDFKYFYDPLIFRYRTLTTLISEGGSDRDSLICHLYFNRLLNLVSETELKLQGISLLRLIIPTGVYEFLTPPYQEQHPDWEAVGFIPVSEQEFYFQWKYSDRNRTLFSYSRFNLDNSEEEETGELSYRKSYAFRDTQDVDAVQVLLAASRRLLDDPGISTAYHIHIRSEGRPLLRRFEYHPADFTSAEEIRLFSLSGVSRNEHLLLLLPDGLLLQASSGSRQVRRLRLPALPEHFLYRDLLLNGPYMFASWEQTAFTDVGAAGIFFTTFPLIP
ncbi:MAG: hypothetical protein JSV89_09705 [Spirochaetaceae bacterium]|nr:MAG: hypothetical protein JSV89_09705 [Spirochaetaceae bacterium]